MITKNPLKEKLGKGRPVLGTWHTLGSPLVCEVLAESGLDFVIVDFEHGPFELGRAQEFIPRCELHGCSPLVRVPANEPWMVLQALDQGAHGVVVPQLASAAEARKLARSAKYHPQGMRGFTPYTRPGGFGAVPGKDYAAKANALTLTTAIVESKEGLSNLDEILEVEGLDIVYFGAYDLSQALGVPGEVRHKTVVDAVKKAAAKASKAGKVAGGFVAKSKDDVKWQLDLGLRFITYDVDSSVLLQGYRGVTEWFKR